MKLEESHNAGKHATNPRRTCKLCWGVARVAQSKIAEGSNFPTPEIAARENAYHAREWAFESSVREYLLEDETRLAAIFEDSNLKLDLEYAQSDALQSAKDEADHWEQKFETLSAAYENARASVAR